MAETSKAKRKRENNSYTMEITERRKEIIGQGTRLQRREQVKKTS
jgi:hypothetical protein